MAKNRYEYFGDAVYTVNTAMLGAAPSQSEYTVTVDTVLNNSMDMRRVSFFISYFTVRIHKMRDMLLVSKVKE